MSDDPTTGRAQRQQAVTSGKRATAIDRVGGGDPASGVSEGTSRSRQMDAQRDIAGEIDVDREGVATRDRLGGMSAFLRSSGTNQFASNLREQFAGAADFVTEQDVAANVDPQAISAAPEVARDRRDDVAQRARRGLAADDPFAQPGDFAADVSASGIESAGLTDSGAQRRASRQFEAETPLRDVGTDDVTATDDGFTLDSEAQRRAAARQFEADIDLFGTGELDPSSDVRQTDSGFGLGEAPARELAAANLSEQTGSTVSPSDVTLSPTDSGGFEAVFEREVGR